METAARVQWVRRLSVIVVIMTFVLMGLGAWVKATGSGLACPDWPACYGQWLPPFPSAENGGVDAEGDPVLYGQAQILYEWAHRAVASILGVPILALFFVALLGRDLDRHLRAVAIGAPIVLLVQFGIGGTTVLLANPAWATTLHLLMATVFFFLVTVAMVLAFIRPTAGATGVLVRKEPGRTKTVYPGEAPFPGEGWRDE